MVLGRKLRKVSTRPSALASDGASKDLRRIDLAASGQALAGMSQSVPWKVSGPGL